jgi:hypothetical protein
MASPMKSLAGKGKKPKSKAKSKKSSKKIKHMHISPADNGGFDVHHLMEGGPDDAGMPSQETQSHPVGSPDELLQHVQSQFGGQLPQQGAGPAGGGGM